MAGEIATAFVRIRPNMAEFKSETRTGVKEAFSGLAEAVGLAFGATETFKFGKDVVEGAADLQHQIENIKEEFGAASDALLKFSDNGATNLGISADAADKASARFGLLFRSLGIGNGTAATMTLNLEKLAGSLAAIRGVDPSTVLQSLPLALTGNVRVLKSLGLAIDQSQIKFAAFKLGLISNVKDALSPAVKAEAVYALATANLGQIQQQAGRHAGDLANVQARLSAEWSNAKDTLGAALLPTFARLTGQLANWLQRMQKSGQLQRDFNTIGRVTTTVVGAITQAVRFAKGAYDDVAGAIGGAKNAAILFLAVVAVNKIRKIAGSLIDELVTNGFARVRVAEGVTKDAWVADTGVMKAATMGLGLTIKSALIETGIGAIVVAIGLVTMYVATHWDLVRAYTVNLAKNVSSIWHGFTEEIKGEMNVLAGVINLALTAPIVGFTQLASKAFGWVPFVGKHIKNAAKDVLDFSEKVGPGLIGMGMSQIREGGQKISDAMYLSAAEALAKQAGDTKTQEQLKKLGENTGGAINDGLVKSVGAGVPAKIAATVSDAMKRALEAAQTAIANSIRSAKDNLDKIGTQLAGSVNKLLDKLGINGPAGKAQKDAIARLRNLIESGAPGFAVTKAAQELSGDLAQAGTQNNTTVSARKAAVQKSINDLTDEFNHGKINLATFNRRLTATLEKDKVSYKIAGKTLGAAFADAYKAEIAGLREQAAAIAAVPAKLRGTGGGGGAADIKIIRPLEVIRRENQTIATLAARQRTAQLKAAERTAKAAEKIAAQTAGLKATKVGTLPGKASKDARNAGPTWVVQGG